MRGQTIGSFREMSCATVFATRHGHAHSSAKGLGTEMASLSSALDQHERTSDWVSLSQGKGFRVIVVPLQ